MPEPIIATKISVPPLRTGLVARPRLLTLLDEAAAHPVALIAAPAGFGKSTLVSVWLRERGRPAAWMSIDRNDNDPTRFLTYLVRALQPLAAGVGTSVLAATGSVQPAEVRAHVTQLINELAAVPGPVTLVVDDWHFIDDGHVTLALQSLVEYQPPQLNLILITREDPPLPLARLRSRGQLGEVRAADLRFTAPEAAAFLRHNTRLALTDAAVAALEQRTEGWIAGLHLAALAMRGTGDPAAFIEAFTGSHRFVLDYLLEEVFTRQPAELQAFLLDTAWLERMSGELCDAVLGRTGSAALLEQVEAAGLFLKPLDEAHHWYRYHRLFAEALQARHQRLAPQRAAEVQRRAAGWFEAAGWLVEAVEHARRSGDMAYYARLLEQHVFRVMGQGEVGLAAGWLAALSEPAIRQSPRLCLDQAWMLYLNHQHAAVNAWLEAAEAGLPAAGQPENGLRGETLALRSLMEDSDAERALRLGQAAASATPVTNTLVHGLIQMALANSYRKLGQLEQALDAFEAAVPLHWEAGNLLAVFIAANDIVLLARPLGRLDRAEALCQQLLARARRSGLGETAAAGVACLGLASVRLERGQWEEAAGMLRQALEQGARSGLRGGLRTDILARQVETGLALVGHGLPLSQESPEAAFEPGALSALPPLMVSRLAYQRVQAGQLDQVAPLLHHLEAITDRPLNQDHLEWRLVRVYHQVMLSIKQHDPAALAEAETEATALAQAAEDMGWSGYLSEILALRAVAEHTRGAWPAALADLERALALAERDGQVMVFVGKGRPMADLLTEAMRQGLRHSAFAQYVLDRFPRPATPPPPVAQTDLAEPPTERELEVLRLMADGLTYEAIAQRLFVSVNTVRYHVKGLYGKLGAGSRAEAIARGRELRLF